MPLSDGKSGIVAAIATIEQPLEIHIAKPGGAREGPFSLEEVNRALAEGQYRSGECWAWHKELPEWIPLYDIRGIIKVATPSAISAIAEPEQTGGSKEEPRREVKQEVPEPGGNEHPVDALYEECSEPESAASQENPPSLDAVPDISVQSEPAATVAKESEISQSAAAETTEPLPANGTSCSSAVAADESGAKAEPATAILARLKENFFQTPEPSNEATSYFNARRASTGQIPDVGETCSAVEWALSEARQVLEAPATARLHPTATDYPADEERKSKSALLAQQFSSGMPFSALEQLFIFTTGDGPSIWSSEIATSVLEATIGENLDRIRQSTPRDVIFNCDLAQLLKRNGAITDAVWRAMAVREPSIVARARQKLCRTFVRTFNLETDTVVAVILFYDHQKLSPSAASP